MKLKDLSSILIVLASSVFILYISVYFYTSKVTFSIFYHFLNDQLLLDFWDPPVYTSLNISFNSNCQLCNFSVRNRKNSNSTPRDVIISAMFMQSHNLIPVVRSIRSTGSKCSIIIFTDSDLYETITTDLSHFLKDCGCLLINIGNLPFSERNKLFMLRNYVTYKFLKVNSHLFDRIIIIDLYDTIIQGDPFISTFPTDAIGISTETARLQGKHYIGTQILLGDEIALSNCKYRKMINCGTLIAVTDIMLKFLKLFIKVANDLSPDDYQKLVETHFPDQSIVNALVYGNILTKYGIRYRLYKPSDEYITIYKLFHAPNLDFSLGNFRYQSDEYPLLIHLFDRSRKFCRSVLQSCPQTFELPITYNYTRCLGVYR